MDIPSFLSTYGGPGGIVAVLVWLVASDRKHSVERRDEIRKDLEREQADNDRLRAELSEEHARLVAAEELVRRLRHGEDV